MLGKLCIRDHFLLYLFLLKCNSEIEMDFYPVIDHAMLGELFIINSAPSNTTRIHVNRTSCGIFGVFVFVVVSETTGMATNRKESGNPPVLVHNPPAKNFIYFCPQIHKLEGVR